MVMDKVYMLSRSKAKTLYLNDIIFMINTQEMFSNEISNKPDENLDNKLLISFFMSSICNIPLKYYIEM